MIYILVLLGFWIIALKYQVQKPGRGHVENASDSNLDLQWLFLTTLVGLRFEVGGDWAAYNNNFLRYTSTSISVGLRELPDFGWLLLVKFFGLMHGSFLGLQLFSAGIFIYGLLSYSRAFGSTSLSVVSIFPVGVLMLSMGFTKQSLSLGIIMWCLAPAHRNKLMTAGALIAAIAIHRASMIVAAPFLLYLIFRLRSGSAQANDGNGNWKKALVLIFALIFLTMVFYIINYKFSQDLRNYFASDYSSRGIYIRHFPTLIASLYIIKLHIKDRAEVPVMIGLMAYIFAVLVCLVLVLGPLAFIDRIAYFLLPTVIYATLTFVGSVGTLRKSVLRLSFIAVVSLTQTLGWLLLGDYSYYWLPYKTVFSPLFS